MEFSISIAAALGFAAKVIGLPITNPLAPNLIASAGDIVRF